ncbi:hypothetical protein BJF87_13705 [Gordonia sp. CNJ-863]|nr:hypothetical protein BJF87_13705 [Gordonia sp. CNJ-863]
MREEDGPQFALEFVHFVDGRINIANTLHELLWEVLDIDWSGPIVLIGELDSSYCSIRPFEFRGIFFGNLRAWCS